MNIKVNTTLRIDSDSDNTFPDDVEVTKDGDVLEFRMDRRTIELSYEQMKQAMRVFAQAEAEGSGDD